jgi:uncharacterized protein YaiL (DUF2058 family)
MGNSLQDQLLKAGLANKKQAVRARKAKNSKDKLKRTGNQVDDEVATAAREAEKAKRDSDRALNRAKSEEAEARAVSAQVRQLVEMNDLRGAAGDVDYRFDEGGVIKTISVTDQHRRDLINGALALVRRGERYGIVARAVAEKVALRDSHCVVVLNDRDDAEQTADDDPYAEFKVPDDLLW